MLLTFPHMGNLFITVKALLYSLDIPFVVPPYNNNETVEIGAKYVPDMACLPLKLNMGNFIMAREMGADTILMTGGRGPCRFGYYGEMHQRMLNQIGADMEVITLDTPKENFKELVERIRKLCGGRINVIKIMQAVNNAKNTCVVVDEIERMAFYTRAIELNKGSTDKVYKWFRNECMKARCYESIKEICKATKFKLRNIPIKEDAQPLKIGIVGEIYTTIDDYTNFNCQARLGNMGAWVSRPVTISNWVIDHMIKKAARLPVDKSFEIAAKPYLKEMIGGHCRETIGHTIQMIEEGYDGVIQIYPLNCMPEIVAQGILKKVSQDYDFPIMTLIIDEMTGEEGFITRIEAFVDLLRKRRESVKDEPRKILLRN